MMLPILIVLFCMVSTAIQSSSSAGHRNRRSVGNKRHVMSVCEFEPVSENELTANKGRVALTFLDESYLGISNADLKPHLIQTDKPGWNLRWDIDEITTKPDGCTVLEASNLRLVMQKSPRPVSCTLFLMMDESNTPYLDVGSCVGKSRKIEETPICDMPSCKIKTVEVLGQKIASYSTKLRLTRSTIKVNRLFFYSTQRKVASNGNTVSYMFMACADISCSQTVSIYESDVPLVAVVSTNNRK